ncbi:MAG: CHAT domain-containing protein [Candidatus Korobacteraceae bacterium]
MPANASTPDTVVVCRPNQLREAAVVFSCFPVANQPALFVIDPPPCSESEYMALHEHYRIMRNLRDEALGQRKARLIVRGGEKTPEWSDEEIDRRVEALTPFRRWAKRNLLLSDLFKVLPLQRAVFLFEATERDMSMFETVPVGRIRDDDRSPLLPDGIPRLTLSAGKGGLDYTRRAWQLVRREEPFPSGPRVTAGDCVALLSGFHAALRLGAPLVVADGSVPPISPAPLDDAQASEAVLIEATEDAAKLVAVQYAVRNDARLCLYPAPKLDAIEDARQRIEGLQEGKLKDEDPSALLRALEESVSSVVPQQVVADVGDLPLTAFTTGVPYHLLRTGAADWSHKPIGLMTGDELLLTSIELYRRPAESGPHFNIVFDPGYFSPRETDGVLRELKSIPEFPLVLQRAAASNTALIALGGAPVDLIYFNTHGSASAMELRDMPLPGYKLLQRITLRNHPVVFNNACLSWTGVGRDFIAAGARSYIGTLWSVNADQAATFAITVANRIIQDKSTIAPAMHDTGADPVTEKAYVFVGPVGTRLREDESANIGEQENMYAVASALLQLAMSVANSGPPPDSPMTWPTIACLMQNAQSLCDELDRRWPEPSIARINLFSDQLSLGNMLPLNQANTDFYANLSMRGLKMQDSVNWKTRGDLKSKFHFRQVCARIAHKIGQIEPAINLLMMSAREIEQEGLTAGPEYLDPCDMYRETGKDDYALESALRAKEAFEKPQAGAEEQAEATCGLMLAYGRLDQLWLRANKLDEASTAAHEGYLAAERADDVKEQSTFKADESRIQMSRGDYKSAVASAEEALKKALWSRDEALKVGAYGTLARALIFAGDLPRAKENAIAGRDLALERDIPSQLVAFQVDLSDIERQSGDLGAALASLREAGDALAIVGNGERIKQVLTKSGELLAKLDSWEALTDTALLATAVLPALEASDRSSVCTFMVHSILSRIKKSGWQEARDGLWRLRTELQDGVAGRAGSIPQQAQFLLDLVEACHDYSKGNQKAALAIMERLDSVSAGGFQLVNFLASPANA